jgi:hypothetical protein
VQESESAQGVPETHTAAALQVPQVAEAPSLQRRPVRGDHEVVLWAASQTWQGLAGLIVPAA